MIRKVVLTSLLLAVASAGAVTVQQLSTTPTFGACGGRCSKFVSCLVPFCGCQVPPGASSGTCVSIPPP